MRSLKATLVAAGLSGLAIAGAAAIAPSAPAAAVTDPAAVAEACASSTVCQYDGASISNAGELESVLPDGVRVVVIPQPDQAESVPSSTLASQLKTATGADTIIVIEDRPAKDRFAVASDGDAAEIAESLYSQDEADGGLAVAAVGDRLASTTTPAASAGAPLDAGLVVGGSAVVVALAVAGGLVMLLRKRRKARVERGIAGNRRVEKELAAALDGEDGEFVREAIDGLRNRAAAYPDLEQRVSGLADHVSELMIRVRARGTDQQNRLLQSQYKDTLAKLLKALGDDYYGDILHNPGYWNDAQQRLDEVRRAVDSVDAQAVENIKQVNESRDLEFKVALDSLTRTVAEAKLSDVYTDRQEP
ncbi:MAG: hypothetical protein QM606_08780 [Leucobacter sp.]